MKSTRIFPLLALGLAGILSACGGIGTGPGSGSGSNTLNFDYLLNHWVNSYEEETDNNVRIYRPADFKQFQVSRFRMEYIFRADNTCDWMFLHPADAHHLRPGTWRRDLLEQNVIRIDQDGTTVPYRIIELTPTLLRMQQLP